MEKNNNKYRVAANITEYHIISKLIKIRQISCKIMNTKMSEIDVMTF